MASSPARDGSSGLIVDIMCRAMNRSFTNVLFGAFGQVQATAAAGEQKAVKSAPPRTRRRILDNASSVVVVPGYGCASRRRSTASAISSST